MTLKMTQTLVRFILTHSYRYKWSMQGFGMLRLYLPGDMRLNIWDNRYTIPNVSLMHTHPWNFDSLIVSGRLTNELYQIVDDNTAAATYNMYKLYWKQDIVPGPGGGLVNVAPKNKVKIGLLGSYEYHAGDMYHQQAEELHISRPDTGTITLNVRQRVGNDIAVVCWPEDTEWVSAEPREATEEEVLDIVSLALTQLEV